ncbi:MAG TPA: GDSL-type esterase/lipase family protein [Fimbriiglobus sp.]
MRRSFVLAAVLFAATSLVAQQKTNSATTPLERKDAGSVRLHKSFLKRANERPVDVLFLGDSITQGWSGNGKTVWKEHFNNWKPANFGIGGDRTEHVLWRITEGKELENVDPKVVVLMIGTNNVGSNSAEQIADGVKDIVGELRKQKPKAKILLLAVFPRSGKSTRNLKDPNVCAADELQPKIKQINDIIAKLDDGKFVTYLDINDKFLNDKGGLAKSIMPDYLHPSKEGYVIWAKAIEAKVESLLKQAKP